MSIKKHTPGPWVVEDIRQSRVEIATADNELIADVFSVWSSDETTAEEAKEVGLKNANLIAATPDLLGALRGMVEVFGDEFGMGESETVDRARAAIAKAEWVTA